MNTEFKLRLIIKFEVKWGSKLEPNKNKLERPSSANGMIVGFRHFFTLKILSHCSEPMRQGQFGR